MKQRRRGSAREFLNRQRRSTGKPRYADKLKQMARDNPDLFRAGTVHHVTVMHDAHCPGIRDGKGCICNPDVIHGTRKEFQAGSAGGKMH